MVFVGVGNQMKGDDGFGPHVAQKIPRAINAETAPENFISKIRREKPDAVVIFDAVDFGARAGEVKVFEASEAAGILLSTHAIPLSKFAKMLEPSKAWLVGVQPASVEFGQGLSEDVLKSAEKISEEVLSWLRFRS